MLDLSPIAKMCEMTILNFVAGPGSVAQSLSADSLKVSSFHYFEANSVLKIHFLDYYRHYLEK